MIQRRLANLGHPHGGGDIGPVKESSRQLCGSWLSGFRRQRAKRQDELILPGPSPVGQAGAVRGTSGFLKLPYQSRRTASGHLRSRELAPHNGWVGWISACLLPLKHKAEADLRGGALSAPCERLPNPEQQHLRYAMQIEVAAPFKRRVCRDAMICSYI